jgi:hypothetical protein
MTYTDARRKVLNEVRESRKSGIYIGKTPISFIVNEKGVAEEVTVSHHLTLDKGVIISQKAVITSKGTTK